MTLTMTARGPEDLLAAVPIVLGFEPADSLVMLTFSGAQRFHARIDMPARPDDDERAVALLLEPACRNGVDKVAFVLYTSDAEGARRTADLLIRRFTAAGVDVVDCLRAADGRWHAVGGRQGGLGDLGVPYDPARHPFRAQAVVEGRITLGSRRELEASLAPDEARVAEVGEALTVATPLAASEVVEVVSRGLANGSAGSAEEVAALLLALRDTRRRDAAWNGMERVAAEAHVRLWSEVVRRSPDSHVADPAALLAFAAWLSGDGALAWCAVDRCLRAESAHRLGRLVEVALERALPPSAWHVPSSERPQ